jgi:Type II secretion system (T2SS), protein E, N-terminal domain
MKLIPSIPPPVWIAGGAAATCENCHRTLALRHVATRKVGIRLRKSWYCSAACFTAAAEKEILRLLKSAGDHAGHLPRMPLGLSLISRGLLTAEQLKTVTDEQKETGGEIGELLVRNRSVTEKQVTAVRAADWGCPVFNLSKHPEPMGLSIPRTLVRVYCMIPVHYVAVTNLLLIGFVHGVEYGLLYVIEQMTGCQTKPCFVTAADFQVQFQRAFESMPTPVREVSFEHTHSVSEIARTLSFHGVEIEADEAQIENGKDYLWARLKSASAVVDLLFRIP